MAEYDADLAEQIVENGRRYTLIYGQAIHEMLPNYKEHEVEAKDTLDVYISHRMTRCTEVKPMMQVATYT